MFFFVLCRGVFLFVLYLGVWCCWRLMYVIIFLLKGIGPQTIVCAFDESLHVAEQFATNFMKINKGIRKL